jgi:hypothetical protein
MEMNWINNINIVALNLEIISIKKIYLFYKNSYIYLKWDKI